MSVAKSGDGISAQPRMSLRSFGLHSPFVMPALVAGIHVLLLVIKDVDGGTSPAMTPTSCRG